MSTPKGAAEVIAALLARAGLDLPVRVRAWDGSEAGTLDPLEPLDAPVLVARSPRALQRILWRPGELGLARAYVSGDLDVEGDLTEGLRLVHGAAHRPGPFGLIKTGPAVVAAAARLGLLAPPPEPPRCELRVRGRRHSRARDQAVIAGHYDVPSAFYQLILDPSMAYSCAYWGPQTVDPGAAQRAKLELIGRKLALEPGQSLLDMGCGWGSLTIHAARARVRVTGVTLSREQGGYVRRRARGLGLNLQVRIQDYRDPLDGPYDAIASVEMGEHVGAARYPAFCAALYGRLRPVGETIRLIQTCGFEVLGVEAMREHYARTIRAWRENFEANLPAITAILTAEQVRVWRLYLAGGALAFEQGRMGVDQILAQRPSR
jgi:cyclopropane-fatty-acyl-phospholipid synthase